MEYAFLSRLSAAHAPNLAHRSAQNKPEKIKQAIEALRAGICPAARSRPHQRWERGPTVCVKEKGEREREKTWVFHSRIDFELNSVVRGRAGADTRCQFGAMPYRCRFKSLTCRCRFKTMPCQCQFKTMKSVLDIKIKSSKYNNPLRRFELSFGGRLFCRCVHVCFRVELRHCVCGRKILFSRQLLF